MTSLSHAIDVALARKGMLDANATQTNNLTSYSRWVFDAVELLLRAEQERQKDKAPPPS